MVTVHWNDAIASADDAGFNVLPASEYDVYIESAEYKPTSNDKASYVVRFKVESGPHEGQSIFNNFVVSPENSNALGFFFRHMEAMGLPRSFFASEPSHEAITSALVKRRCRVKVSIREYNGQDKNQVDRVMPPIGDAPPSASGMDIFGAPASSGLPGAGSYGPPSGGTVNIPQGPGSGPALPPPPF